MTELHPTPGKEQIALLEPFERLGLSQIQVISTPEQASTALQELSNATALGFDTESKPTFAKNELSDGPHIVQLATLSKAYIFQLHDADCRRVVALLLESNAIIKAGFGLGDDRRRLISKLGVDPQGVLDLNTVFRNKGYRKDMGAARWQYFSTNASSNPEKPPRPTGPTPGCQRRSSFTPPTTPMRPSGCLKNLALAKELQSASHPHQR